MPSAEPAVVRELLVICSKSAWSPPIRREHALARLAADHGHPVVFVERPADVRLLASAGWSGWLRSTIAPRRTGSPRAGVDVWARSAFLPPHRNGLAAAAERAQLRRILARVARARATVLATVPWQWPALHDVQGVRRVFDCADDWRTLLPSRTAALDALYGRIANEADTIVAASDSLARLFPQASPQIVPNATDPELLTEPAAMPQERLLVYVGTLSERFDAALLAAVLERLPDWRADLYGPCQYARRGQRPGEELEALLALPGGRVRWRGPVERSRLAAVIDSGAVAVIPFRRHLATGDLMKIYDYAARGRPIVATPPSSPNSAATLPPYVREAERADAFAAAVVAAAQEPATYADARRTWARAQSWESRWPEWSAALFTGPAAAR
jgi:glycosyltransferase involved in cell wall biosynthesis